MKLVTGMKSALNEAFIKSSTYFINRDPSINIIVVADPRAGSTWLSEILLRHSPSALIWEPLHIGENPLFRNIGFGYRQHIPQGVSWPQAKERFEKVLSGKNLNTWTTKFTTVSQVVKADQLLIKFCRAGLLLPWLIENFHFKMKPVYMVRHPFAVVASQLKNGSWDQVPDKYQINQSRYNHLEEIHSDFLLKVKSRAEVLLCTWCITNGYLLNHPWNNKSWVTLTYEELLLDPKKALSRIYCDHWGLDLPEAVLKGISTPSRTVQDHTTKLVTGRQLMGWSEYFSDEQIDRFQYILDYFNVTLYNQSFLPVESAYTI